MPQCAHYLNHGARLPLLAGFGQIVVGIALVMFAGCGKSKESSTAQDSKSGASSNAVVLVVDEVPPLVGRWTGKNSDGVIATYVFRANERCRWILPIQPPGRLSRMGSSANIPRKRARRIRKSTLKQQAQSRFRSREFFSGLPRINSSLRDRWRERKFGRAILARRGGGIFASGQHGFAGEAQCCRCLGSRFPVPRACSHPRAAGTHDCPEYRGRAAILGSGDRTYASGNARTNS